MKTEKNPNIDEQGNVLFLDQERLNRKDTPYPPYQNHPNGLGIFNFIKEHILFMNKKRWPLALKLYRFFIKYSVWMKEDGLKAKIFKRGIMLEPVMKAHTASLTLPLNVDLTEEKEKVQQIVIEEMEKAYTMQVPLRSDSGWGKNWLEAH